MEQQFWHNCWERNSLGFHQADVNPLLVQHFLSLCQAQDKRVFVPLCGKSLDMLYLAQSFEVIGSELSAIACEDFFQEQQLPVIRTLCEPHECFSHKNLTLYQGDFFKLQPTKLPVFDWIYDRAALIALPPEMQQKYVAHLQRFINPGTRVFLLTLEFPQQQLSGPPFATTEAKVGTLFKGFNVKKIAEQPLTNKQFAQRVFDVDYLIEKLYLISRDN